MTRVVSFISASGGVGKTKISLLLTGYLRKYKGRKRLLFIDLDPTAGASILLVDEDNFYDACKNGKTMSQLICDFREGKTVDIDNYTIRAKIYDFSFHILLPGLAPEDLMYQMDKLWESASPGADFKKLLKESGIADKYDYVIVDTIPFFVKRYTTLVTYISDCSNIILRASMIDLKRTLRMIRDPSLKGTKDNMFIIFNLVSYQDRTAWTFVHRVVGEDFIKQCGDNPAQPSREIETRVNRLMEIFNEILASGKASIIRAYLKKSAIIEEFPIFRKESEVYMKISKQVRKSAKKNISAFLRILTERNAL